jgi:hypothetical protein
LFSFVLCFQPSSRFLLFLFVESYVLVFSTLSIFFLIFRLVYVVLL